MITKELAFKTPLEQTSSDPKFNSYSHFLHEIYGESERWVVLGEMPHTALNWIPQCQSWVESMVCREEAFCGVMHNRYT